MNNITYKQIRNLIDKMTDEQQNQPARVIERATLRFGDIELGAEFPLTDMGVDEDGQVFFSMEFRNG